ncbi:MAG: FAD-dependent oxidoreductase, partial [Myxococcales bacterium]|nr:FAD-dependent oxidoreductase [Myxococcales bacterium]
NIRTVQTPCVQLWLDKSLEELGMDSAEWGLRPNSAPQTVVYADPLYSWIEMTSIMERHEAWPAERRPRALVYYTGALEDAEPQPPRSDRGFPAREQARVTEMTKAWLDHHMGFFWPKAHARGTGAFDLSVLHDPAGEAAPSGRQRLTRQLIRHNAEPSARYTLAVPGSERFRLAADESGYDNLFLAGDWTNFGVNVGYVEGTIVSGIRAAAALRRSLGLPHDREIYEDAPFQRFGPAPAR